MDQNTPDPGLLIALNIAIQTKQMQTTYWFTLTQPVR